MTTAPNPQPVTNTATTAELCGVCGKRPGTHWAIGSYSGEGGWWCCPCSARAKAMPDAISGECCGTTYALA